MARDSTVSGWVDIDNSTESKEEYGIRPCENLKAGQSVEDCIDEHTFSRSSVLKDVLWGFDPNNSILSDGSVGEDFTMTWQGKFFSFYAQKTMVADDDGINGTRLSLVLGFGLTFQIFIHDPDFFEINFQPIYPVILKTIKPVRTTSYNFYYTLAMTEVRKLGEGYINQHGCSLDVRDAF